MSGEPSAEKDAHVVVDHRVVNSRGRRWIEATCSCGAVVSNRRCRFFTTAFAVHVKRATRVASPAEVGHQPDCAAYRANGSPLCRCVTSPETTQP